MKLADLRKLSVRQNLRIRFQLAGGMECVITEHGIAQVPALCRTPDFNLEQELISVAQFVLEPVTPPDKKHPAAPRHIGREELAALTAAPAATPGVGGEDE